MIDLSSNRTYYIPSCCLVYVFYLQLYPPPQHFNSQYYIKIVKFSLEMGGVCVRYSNKQHFNHFVSHFITPSHAMIYEIENFLLENSLILKFSVKLCSW